MKTKLREHPELIDQGVRTWPPNWVRTSGKETTATDGEIGILKDVKTYDSISSRCFLFIEHNGATFMGRVSCDSAMVCQVLVNLLKRHIGEPLRSIGDLPIELPEIPLSFRYAA
jgi:hypothetical protein